MAKFADDKPQEFENWGKRGEVKNAPRFVPPPEEECISFEKAKELKEAGHYIRHPHWFYKKIGDGYKGVHEGQKITSGIYIDVIKCEFDPDTDYAAVCIGELLKEIPHSIVIENTHWFPIMSKDKYNNRIRYIWYYKCNTYVGSGGILHEKLFKNLSCADGCADMLMWLEKNKYITF